MAGRRVLICTYGTRGDVEPFVALALGLRAAGHTVLLATSDRFRAFVEGHGIAFHPMSDASLAAIETPDGRAVIEGGAGPVARVRAGIRLARRSGAINAELMRETWEAARAFGPDRIVFHMKTFGAPHVAEKLKVPAILATLQPMIVPTNAFPPMGLPRLPGGNRLAYGLVRRSFSPFRKSVNRFRREVLDLPPVSRGREVLFPTGAGTIPVLHGYSPAVLERPPDWPASAQITGYWRLDTVGDYAPPAELAAFLRDGPAPVFVGFSSMTSVDPQALGHLVTGALRRAGQRGIVAKGWAGLDAGDGDDVLAISPAPHGWLFPHMAAVVHHGGAGSTAEGFHAGVPSVICPFFGDQPGWARLSVALGVGVEPIPRRRLTEERLAAAIGQAVSDPVLRENARALAARLGTEDGVAAAVAIITAA